jgi:multicomponent Na+:H+ antiporter subunit E
MVPTRRPSAISRVAARPGALLARLILFAVLWWTLVEGAIQSWLAAGLSVIAATAVGMHLLRPDHTRWSPLALLRFLPYFLVESIRGGVDVSRRAFHPRLPIAPGFYPYRLRLRSDPARVFFATSMSLLPGTLGARTVGDVLHVHLLDLPSVRVDRLMELEALVASIFAERLEADTPPGQFPSRSEAEF